MSEPAPRLSVVIPTYRRPRELGRTLEALERQRPGTGPFEVVVVDDPREDDPAAVAAAVDAGRRPYPVRQLSRERPGVSAARNAGWRAARGPLVLFLGDDVLAAPDLVAEHLAWHDRHPDEPVGVLGSVRWARELPVTPFMRWLERGVQFDYGSIAGTEAGWGHFYTANVSLPRAALERVGGFDEERFPFGYEDLDLGHRLFETGFRLLHNAAAAAEHLHAPTVEEWRARMTTVARAEREWVRLHPELEPYFHDRLAAAAASPPARGRGARLARWVGPGVPVLGPRVWASADLRFRQALAPSFLAAWEDAQPEAGEPERASSSGGSEPGGPK